MGSLKFKLVWLFFVLQLEQYNFPASRLGLANKGAEADEEFSLCFLLLSASSLSPQVHGAQLICPLVLPLHSFFGCCCTGYQEADLKSNPDTYTSWIKK